VVQVEVEVSEMTEALQAAQAAQGLSVKEIMVVMVNPDHRTVVVAVAVQEQ
jgi:hypothetical protein